MAHQPPAGQRQAPAIDQPELPQRQAAGVHQPVFHRIRAGFTLQGSMQVWQRHQHVGMPALQKTLQILPLPGKRAEQQAHLLDLIDAICLAELQLMHITPLFGARLASQPQCRATGLRLETACMQLPQLHRGQRLDERGQLPGVLPPFDATTEHQVQLLLFEQRRHQVVNGNQPHRRALRHAHRGRLRQSAGWQPDAAVQSTQPLCQRRQALV